MRMIVYVSFPVETFNAAVRDGSAGAKMKRILDQLEPEAAYFTDRYGQRSTVLIVDLEDASKIPAIAEPWFLLFNAGVEIHPVMGPQDLASAGLERLGKEWV
ncbi:MAG TPA: panthothenate synthetase [Edaphobacter sp.]|nr:panthothenate synthetase [Edaphobacter sp.]